MQVTGRFLESELSCAICLGLLKNTRTTKECLHRFCNECISQALRSGNKECPNCRKKLASMRSLRPDPIFDQIISIVFPNRDEMEQQERKLLEKLNSNNNRRALVNSIEQGKRYQAARRGRRTKKDLTEEDGEAGPSASTSEAGSVLGGPRAESEMTDRSVEDSDDSKIFVEIVPNEMKPSASAYAKKWKRRLIKVKSCATSEICFNIIIIWLLCVYWILKILVAHLSHFILFRLLDDENQAFHDGHSETRDISKIRIDLRLSSQEFRELEPKSTLAEVQEQLWNLPRHMILAFSIRGKLKLK